MKRILFVLIVILTSFEVYAQTYTVKIRGHITLIGGEPQMSTTCTDAGGNGLMNIILMYEDGTSDYLLDLPLNSVGKLNGGFGYSKNIPMSKKIREISFYSATIKTNNNPTSDGCNEPWILNKRIPIDFRHCFSKRYDQDVEQIFESRFGPRSYATIYITPNPNLTFTEERDVNSVYYGCEDEAVGIEAPSGYIPGNSIYNWEFLDNVNLEERDHPDYALLKKREEDAKDAYDECESSIIIRNCQNLFLAWLRAKQNLNAYEGPKTIGVSVWRPISNIRGRSNIALRLSDIYPNVNDQAAALNSNIQIRMKPNCRENLPESNIVTVHYLPPPPRTIAEPVIENLSCSYSTIDRFKLYFDRQIQSHEAIDINLFEKDAASGGYIGVGNNIRITSFTRRNNRWEYEYQSPSNITEGEYKVQITGYERGGSSITPFCDPTEKTFTIETPPRVVFEVEKIQDENCHNSRDGQIRITASGGTGSYQYSVDNGRNWVSMPRSPYTISALVPGTYNIQVRDSNGCYDKVNISDPNKNIPITIEAIAPIEHQIPSDGVIHPSRPRPEPNDATITITRVSGGTPFTGVGYLYNYQVFLNGTTPFQSGIVPSGGITITELPAGNHTIVYTDANGCSTTPPINLPEIKDPLPIEFEINKQDPDCSDADGSMEVTNLEGGYPPYIISWSKDGSAYSSGSAITGSQGSYDVTILDSRGIEATQPDIRFENIPLPIAIANIDIQPILCYGNQAAVTLTAQGGKSGAYQYALWTGETTTVWQDSNVFSLDANTTAGYRFRVRDRNIISCDSEISDRQLISQPNKINIETITITDNTIFNGREGAIEINVTEGTPNYTITWERNGVLTSHTGTSISSLIAGNYIAIVQDGNNCKVRSSVIEVKQPEELTVSIVETIAIPCYNEVGTLTANAGGGSLQYTYQWYKNGELINAQTSNVLSDIQAGTYRVRIEDGFTSSEMSFQLEEPEELILPSPTIKHVSCFSGNDGEVITNPQGGTRPYYFSIDDKNTYISEEDLTNLTIKDVSAGIYDLWLKDANGCEVSTPQRITLNSPDEIKVIPTSIVHVTTLGGNNGSITMGEVTGGVGTYTYSWSKQGTPDFIATTRDIQDISSGIYTIKVEDTNGCIVEKTFEVKQPLPMVVNIDIMTPILCYNDAFGELVAMVEGGYPIESTPADFEYRWYKVESSGDIAINTDITLDRIGDLISGRYKVVVSDSQGTTAETSFDLTQPEELVVSLSNASTEILCYGNTSGSIDITVTGGPKDPVTGEYLAYSYKWTNTDDPSFEATTEDLPSIPAGTYQVVVIDDNLCTTSLSEPVVIHQPDAPLEISNVVVNNLTGYQTANGSISLDVRGGVGPYAYTWSNLEDPLFTSSDKDITDLKRGNYQLLITDDNGCTISLSREVTEPEELIVTIPVLTIEESISCFNEKTKIPLTSIVRGGVEPYTYLWYEQTAPAITIATTPDTQIPVLAGEYIVVVTDSNGNMANTTYTVSQPEELKITEIVTHLECYGENNGEINITVEGGTPPYTYYWNNGETTEDVQNLISGVYTVNVRDANNCIAVKMIEVEQPTQMYVYDITRNYPSSNGLRDGNITVDIRRGTPPYNYAWRDSQGVIQSSTTHVLSGIGAEKYSLTVTDSNDCILQIDDVDLFEPPTLEVNVLPFNVISCNGSTTSGSLSALSEGGRPFNNIKQYNYQWYNADTDTPIGTDSSLLNGIGAGNYYVTISDAVGATATSLTFEFKEPEKLEIIFDTDYVDCGDDEDWTIVVQVKGGTAPYSIVWNTGDTGATLENVVAGSYSIEVTDVRGCYVTSQVVTIAPEKLTVAYTPILPTCYNGCDGSILLETEGGTPPYTYQWNNGDTREDLTNICSDTYNVVITDSKGCQITKEIILESPEELIVDLGEDIVLCKDQSIVLNATIADSDATYQWTSSTGFSSTEAFIEVQEAATYEITVTDSKGCLAVDSIFIDKVTDVISAQFITSTQIFVGEKFVVVDNSDPIPDHVDWIFPEEAEVIYEDNNYAEAVFSTPGEYEITMQTYLGLCTAVTTKKVIVVEQEFEGGEGEENTIEIQSYLDYKVYPNPTTNGRFKAEVHLSKPQDISLKIYNVINNTLIDYRKAEAKDTYTLEYDMSILPSGIYFILLETPTINQVRKLMIE
ncbi:T9SS type A sorting domain-containing protein [Aquimarina aquimarini]|uniref:T9SS type A sorting domain-containing protein n=1 Tax=Aquimarina aquimarini TaxID=1191734 RepID=UPI000D54EF52|nr:T9SS type A sorting domain-containing protein [Aquimarina aquimarini]